MSSTWKKAALRLGSILGVIVPMGLVMLNPQMRAQTSNAQLSGLITDTTGAVVTGAQIRAVNVATNVPYTAVSNGSGIYVLPELLPGPYRITVPRTGIWHGDPLRPQAQHRRSPCAELRVEAGRG